MDRYAHLSGAPPVPLKVVTTDGRTVIADGDVAAGQNVWQSLGGMEVGSVWGHGSYVAPDWTADWLHREAMFTLDHWANETFGREFTKLDAEQQAQLVGRLTAQIRANTYDPQTGAITIDPVRRRVRRQSGALLRRVRQRSKRLCHTGGRRDRRSALAAIGRVFLLDLLGRGDRSAGRQNQLHAQLALRTVGRQPAYRRGRRVDRREHHHAVGRNLGNDLVVCRAARKSEPAVAPPDVDPLGSWQATPSQQATLKYFWIVAALLLVQMLLGVVTAHYGVEGDSFYGIPLSDWLPYSVTRTWHIQLGLFWIATAWLGAGLFIGPLVSDTEPAGQRLGVNVLFLALLVVVVGSLTGEWLSIHNKLSDAVSFYFGHQGYEYVDLGRAWQMALLAGLLLWLFLVVRVLRPALKKPGEQKQLVWLLLVSTTAIALFYGAGLAWGHHTHLTIVEYWRWWVVHLWVEGFFEVFATTVIAFFFMRLNLIRPGVAAAAALLSATIFLSGGIIGTCHHLYFTGTPTVAIAWGSVFSALEVVPLVLVGFDAMEDIRRSKATLWVQRYKWPIYFFVAVAFWNMVGAGLFGFMINPPIALYYMQGLNTTPVHGHAALFGVYGMLGIGLMLVCLRALIPGIEWKDGLLRFAFWSLNGGLFAMCVLSLLPVGLMQTWASVDQGYWYARSSEFLQTPLMQNLRWLRIPGDTIFALGAVALTIFIAGLKTGHSFKRTP